MKANEPRPALTRPTGSPVRVDDAQIVPSYLQRYADELEAWHARRRPVAGQKT
jgi:hypothetical protein